MLGVHACLVFTIQVVDCIANALEMPRIKLLWSLSGTQISNLLDTPSFTGRFRKMRVPNFRDDGTITEILTCLNPGSRKLG